MEQLSGKPMAGGLISAVVLLSGVLCAVPAFAADGAPRPARASQRAEAGQAQMEPDPLEPFNSAMFTFNLKLDDWVIHPAAQGYSYVAPGPVREAVGRFFDNVGVLPRVVNNLVQLRLAEAGTEVARFGINTTVGIAGLFDPAGKWFGLEEHPDDFGLTLRYYGTATGPYLMLPFFGPSTISDTAGLIVDSFMDPLYWFVPWWVSLSANGGSEVASAVNYRSLHMEEFEEANRYAIDLYGAVQDAYLQTRQHRTAELKEGK